MNVQRQCGRHGRQAIAAAVALFLGTAGSAGGAPAAFRIERWDTGDGLQQNTVKTICQTPDGYLWIGTRFGYARYDGAGFTTFSKSSADLFDSNTSDMAADLRDGSLWILSMRNVIHQTADGFATIPLEGPWNSSAVRLAASRAGGVWIASYFGLLRVEKDTAVPHPLLPGGTNAVVYDVIEDDTAKTWLAARHGLVVYDPASRTSRTVWSPPALDGTTNHPTAVATRRAGGLWIGTSSGGLYSYHNGHTARVLDLEEFGPGAIMRIVEASNGALWFVAERRRLFRLHESVLERISTSHGLVDEEVYTAFEDREANLWVGTEAGGLHRIQPRLIRAFSTTDGLIDNMAWSICNGRDGVLWIGTQQGVSRLQNGTFTDLELGDGVGPNDVMCVREDHRGILWIGTRSRGLFRYDGDKPVAVPTPTTTQHNQINGIYEDRSGSLWVSTHEGLLQMRDDRIIQRFTVADGLPYREIRAVHVARDGTLWVATWKGLAMRAPGSAAFRVFFETNGLADDFSWCFHEDPEGGIWMGSEKGLTWYDRGRFHVFSDAPGRGGLFDNVINDIIEDDAGYLWIGCNRGVYRVARRQFREVIEGTRRRLDCHVYGTSDGMLHRETNGEHQPSACRAPDGSIWFPTLHGIVQIHPDRMPINQLPPPVVIEQVLVEQTPIDLRRRPVRLRPGSGRRIEFRYTANSLTDPANVHLSYQLLPFDQEPQFDTGQRRKLYTKLTPGSYEFRVTGCNNHGVWNSRPATFAFTIEPHLHETASFYVVLFALLAGGAYAVHRRRLNTVRLINRLEREHAVDGERSRIASEMHDDLGAHLTQIALLGEMAARKLPPDSPAAQPVRQIATASRDLFRAMDEVVWAVNPKHDTLDGLASYLCQHAQDFLRSSEVRCRLDFPENLPAARVSADTRHNLFLAFKEALNNAVRHAAASEIRVSLCPNLRTALLTVEDDGLGFDPADDRPDGNGLENMRRRLATCGGNADIRSSPGRGTCVQFTFPLQPEPSAA